jgi:basic membrane protein A
MDSIVGQTLLERYFVEAFVGKGNMAEVYKVWDKQRATSLAIKVLREDLALDKVFLRRFRREAETLTRLQHPNIVRCYGLEQDGRLVFMVMDYVEGQSLRHEIYDLKSPMTPHQALEWMTPICSALHYAHAEGVIHCDVKPANVMLHSNGSVLVADFGIARMTDSATATMVGAGTPAYMSPEQVRGEDPIPQTDIYALGIVLYEMLTGGERPFTGEQAQTGGPISEKVRWEQLHLLPPSPRTFNPALSAEIESVVLRCLEKDPADRFQTSFDLLNALQNAAAEPTVPRVAQSRQPRPARQPEAPPAERPEPPLAVPAAPARKISPAVWIVVGGIALIGLALAALGGIPSGGSPGGAGQNPAASTEVAQVVETQAVAVVPTEMPTSTVAATKLFRVAVVAPSAKNDLAFSQSMYDALVAVQKDMGQDKFRFSFSENLFNIDDANAAIRDYAAQGYDLVIAHGSQYGAGLAEIAPDFPKTAFAWGTTVDTFSSKGIKNVFAYDVRSEQGGYVLGVMAARLSKHHVIGEIGPIEVGDAKLYIDGFKEGVLATDPTATDNSQYTGSFSDTTLFANAASTFMAAGADVLTGSSEAVTGAISVAKGRGVLWFGTQSDQSPLAPNIVVASQVYDWTAALEDMITSAQGGTFGGKTYSLTLANGGLKIVYNPAYSLPADVKGASDAAIVGIGNGTIRIKAAQGN